MREETRRGASEDQSAAFSHAPFPRDSAALENAAGKADLGFRRTSLRKQAACDVRDVFQESLFLKRLQVATHSVRGFDSEPSADFANCRRKRTGLDKQQDLELSRGRSRSDHLRSRSPVNALTGKWSGPAGTREDRQRLKRAPRALLSRRMPP